MQRKALSPIERGVAVSLALIWLCGGGFALYLGIVHVRWGVATCGIAALAYGAAWLRVAARSHLLTWRELVTPWKRV